ncbi:hypothetical protein BKK52_12930 [Rodentibacter trehalosifermentans]|uniref:Uncharacterized protein n=1 Tax=Rodentibacter trehalosifermentans TaxID=1908263 RepID=A0A1V3IRX1_9PAST|nr:hypothetical protein BKK52_12930 [Rodentibacter trehalosifermentans]
MPFLSVVASLIWWFTVGDKPEAITSATGLPPRAVLRTLSAESKILRWVPPVSHSFASLFALSKLALAWLSKKTYQKSAVLYLINAQTTKI